MKNQQKFFPFWHNAAWSCWGKFWILQREYLSSEVNVLTKSLNILDMTKADFLQINFPRIQGRLD